MPGTSVKHRSESTNQELTGMGGRAQEVRKRKKTQPRACDKRTPKCSLCTRTGLSCTYPTRRRRQPELSPQRILQSEGQVGLMRLLDQIDEGSLHEAIQRRQSGFFSTVSPQAQPSQDTDPPADESTQFPIQDATSADTEADNDSLSPAQPSPNTFSMDFINGSPGQWVAGSLMALQDSETALVGLDNEMECLFATVPKDNRSGGINVGFNNPSPMPTIFAPLAMPPGSGTGRNLSPVPISVTNNLTDAYFQTISGFSCGGERRYTISVPATVADDLIDSYFQNVAGFIPLFHRSNFCEHYRLYSPDAGRYQDLVLEEALTLNAIFALSARFSGSSHFAEIPIKDRAAPFLKDGKTLYHDAMSLDGPVHPNLQLLQGFILLGWCYQISGGAAQSCLLSGICCHLAYELGLNNIDRDIMDADASSQWTSVEEWSSREGLRRLWWLIWELDMFSTTVLRRPHTIEKTSMNVLLPVSDVNFFSNTPVVSVPIIQDYMQTWKSLSDSPNQDARAWFLVASFLQAIQHDMLQGRRTSPETIADFQSQLTCFSILLPSCFHLGQDTLSFDDENFASSNWIVTTHLMVQGLRTSISIWCEDNLPANSEVALEAASGDAAEKLISRVMRNWEPKYIPLACPLICALLVGPSASNAIAACRMARDPERPRSIFLEMLKLVIGNIGAFWEIGSAMLELVHVLESRGSLSELSYAASNDLERLPSLLPRSI